MDSDSNSLVLSFNQEWALLNYEVGLGRLGSSIFPALFRLCGAVDRLALERAINAVVSRHAALGMAYSPSTRYAPADRLIQLKLFRRTALFIPGLYTQRFVPDARVELCERDLASVEDLNGAIEEELSHPLDITCAPRMRGMLLHLDGGGRMLLLVMSHLAVDGWSMGTISRELTALYEAGVTGTALTLAPIRFQAPDFAAWQHGQFRSGELDAEMAYWREQWTSIDGGTVRHRDLPFSLHAPPDGRARNRVARYREPLGPGESAAVRAVLSRSRVTRYVFFRTVVSLVLYHCTGKRRLAFWANFANRQSPALAATVAWCANTHIVTLDVDSDATCADLCRQVGEAVAQAQTHEALPLPALWQRLGHVPSDYDSRINFDLLPKPRRRPGPAPIAPVPLGIRTADLDIRLQEDDEGFALVATYSVHRYAAEGVAGMLAGARRVAVRFAEAPETRVADCAGLIG